MAKTYLLTRIPPDLWRHCKSRAANKETNMRAVIIAGLEQYASEPLTRLGIDLLDKGDIDVRKKSS